MNACLKGQSLTLSLGGGSREVILYLGLMCQPMAAEVG